MEKQIADSTLDMSQFKNTDVIKSLKNNTFCELPTGLKDSNEEPLSEPIPQKSNRGRKKKYQTDEERIAARRQQQKQYRERKKKELAELRELKETLQKSNVPTETSRSAKAEFEESVENERKKN